MDKKENTEEKEVIIEENQMYELVILSKDVHKVEVPEGIIYTINTKGNGSGSRPIFIGRDHSKEIIEAFLPKLREMFSFIEDRLKEESSIKEFEKVETPIEPIDVSKVVKETKPKAPKK